MIINDKWVESSSWGFYSLTGKILSCYSRVGNSGNVTYPLYLNVDMCKKGKNYLLQLLTDE